MKFRLLALIGLLVIISACVKKTEPIVTESDLSDQPKIHSRLLNYLESSNISTIPSYFINEDDTWNVRVICKEVDNIGACEDVIRQYGTIIERSWKYSFNIKIQKDKVYSLSKENVIKLIEEHPGIPVNDDPVEIVIDCSVLSEQECHDSEYCLPMYITTHVEGGLAEKSYSECVEKK